MIYQDKKQNKKRGQPLQQALPALCLWTHELVIYDKSYQMKENGLELSYEKMPNGVIRLRCTVSGSICAVWKRSWMFRHRQPAPCTGSAHPGGTRQEVQQMLPNVSYYQAEVLQEKIRASHYKKKNKEAMYKLVELLKTGPVCGQGPGEAGSQTIRYLRHLEEFRETGESARCLCGRTSEQNALSQSGLVELLNTVETRRHCGAVYGCKVQVTAGSVGRPVWIRAFGTEHSFQHKLSGKGVRGGFIRIGSKNNAASIHLDS